MIHKHSIRLDDDNEDDKIIIDHLQSLPRTPSGKLKGIRHFFIKAALAELQRRTDPLSNQPAHSYSSLSKEVTSLNDSVTSDSDKDDEDDELISAVEGMIF
jgi:CRISPR/Cas system CMR subunit Cmr6 (Cas7 group RAMP superfamily)